MNYKKAILSLLGMWCILVVIVTTLTGCGEINYDFYDTTYNFDRAIIELPNGYVIDGEVESWLDFDDGDQIQVKIDGVTYLVHSSDVCLISNP